jgi:hypothetical protein
MWQVGYQLIANICPWLAFESGFIKMDREKFHECFIFRDEDSNSTETYISTHILINTMIYFL